MTDIKKLLQTIDSLSEAVLPANHPDWNLTPQERAARQNARIAADSSADAEVWNKGLKIPVSDKKFVGDVHHQDEDDEVKESSNLEKECLACDGTGQDPYGERGESCVVCGGSGYQENDEYDEGNELSSESDSAVTEDWFDDYKKDHTKKQPSKTHSSDCGWNYGHDCNCGKTTLTHDSDCGWNYGHDCDCGLKESAMSDDSSLTEEIRAAFEDYVKNKAAPADEKTRVTITYKDGHTQTKSVTEKERKRYETSDSVEKVEDAKGGKGRLDDTRLSEDATELQDIDKKIEFQQLGLANAQFKGPMATMHRKNLRKLFARRKELLGQKSNPSLSEDRKTNALWAQINDYEKRAKATKDDIKKNHLMQMAANLRKKLPVTESNNILHKGTSFELDESKTPQSMKQALDNALSKVEPGSKLDKKIKQHNDMVRRFGKGTMTAAPDGYHIDKKGMVRLGEGAEKAMPIDMMGKKCSRCNTDTYQERSQHDDYQGTVTCSCGHSVPRWKKAEPGIDESVIDEAKGKSENRELWDKINSRGVVPSIDRERYTDLSHEGLEGPFRQKNGQVLYYDPRAGQYYNRDTDMYVDQEDFDAMNEGAEIELTELSDKTLSDYKDKAVAAIIPAITKKGDIKKAAKHSRGSTLAQSKLDRLAKIRSTLETLQDAVKEAKSKVGKKLEEAPIDQVVADANPDQATQPSAGTTTTAKTATGGAPATPATNSSASKPATSATATPTPASLQANAPEAMKNFVDAIAKNPTVASNPNAAKALGAVLGVKPK